MMARKKNPTNGKPELDDGYLKLANELVDQFVKLKITATQWNILFLVMRETYGYNRKAKDLSVSYIAKAIGVSEYSTSKAVQDLIQKKILVEYSQPTPRASREIGINKYYLDWVSPQAKLGSDPKGSCPQPSLGSDPKGSCPQAKLGSDPKEGWGLDPKEPCPKQIQYKDTSKDNKPTASDRNYSAVEEEYFGGW